ncbi:MAG: glycogen/starch synthase, partial [Sedimentisphaerales bacterium]
MKTFMLGWEFPPYISGGLGTACYGLTKAMDKLGIEVMFILPKGGESNPLGSVKMVGAEEFQEIEMPIGFKNVRFRVIASTLRPYANVGSCHRKAVHCASILKVSQGNLHPGQTSGPDNYGGDIFSAVSQYAEKAASIAETENFDVVHAHDWMTYPAGEAVSQQSRKPLVVHVHSTEFDRSGEHVNQIVYDTERSGMHAAAKIIAVSNFTKNIILK